MPRPRCPHTPNAEPAQLALLASPIANPFLLQELMMARRALRRDPIVRSAVAKIWNGMRSLLKEGPLLSQAFEPGWMCKELYHNPNPNPRLRATVAIAVS